MLNNLDKINIGSVVRTFFPLKKGGKLVLNGVVVKITPPSSLEVDFVPDRMSDSLVIDSDEKCLFTHEIGDEIYSFFAKVETISEGFCVTLELLETITHAQKRRFFRVDADLKIKLQKIQARKYQDELSSFQEGELINISGSGILVLLREPIEADKNVRVEMTLPGNTAYDVNCAGKVVRINYRNDTEYEVAIHFDDIDQPTRDKIVAFCYAEERKKLRLRVKVRAAKE